MEIQEIIERNYKATVSRGLIKFETSGFEFVEKLKEEVSELETEWNLPYAMEDFKRQIEEMADCALVLFAMAKHFNVDLLKAMEEKVIYNEMRKD